MGILDGIVEWLATQVMNLLDLISTSVLGALGYAGMWAAVFADVGVAVIAILNAMRALKAGK